MPSVYGWVIDRDHIEMKAKSVMGPRNIAPKIEEQLKTTKNGQKFQLFDDDGNLYYSGRIIGEYDGFEPLDDYGEPAAGCTEIKLFNSTTNEYETL